MGNIGTGEDCGDERDDDDATEACGRIYLGVPPNGQLRCTKSPRRRSPPKKLPREQGRGSSAPGKSLLLSLSRCAHANRRERAHCYTFDISMRNYR